MFFYPFILTNLKIKSDFKKILDLAKADLKTANSVAVEVPKT